MKASAQRARRARIERTVAAIPHGRVATYGQVADLAGVPRGARLVGRVLARSPDGTALPWHRVVAAGGRIAFPEGSAERREQVARLAGEGVLMRAGRVALDRHRWQPLDALLWGPPPEAGGEE